MDIERLRLLRALRLKGRVLAADLPAAAGVTAVRSDDYIKEFTSDNLVEEVRGRLKLTPQGRDQLDKMLVAERSTVDHEALAALYAEFDEHNSALKSLMTRWQLKGPDTPNDHTDPEYDQAIVDDLVALDADFTPLVDRMVEVAPRLGHYPARLANALDRVTAGDHSWFAKPLADSYHTVWFELHEDLIGLAGLSRVEEAAAGRAE